jgi:LmbE family N-acetylglucosaminyl deacetylase
MNNILAIVAHADDLELMAGGSIIKWIAEGKKIHVINLTDSELILPDGTKYRSKEEASAEEKTVSEYLGYSIENGGNPALQFRYNDESVVMVLNCIKKYNIDTLLTHFEKDAHFDHEISARIAIAASRRVPNILMGQANYFLREFFTPNVFVDITDTWEKKIKAMELYKSQWRLDWFEFLDATSHYYGKIAGVERAEGFYTPKFRLGK